MARTEIIVRARPEAVFAVLSDPTAYQTFVVGTRRVRRFDRRWPEPGTALHYSVGIGPLVWRDQTDAVEHVPSQQLVVRPRVRPFVTIESRFELEALGDRTLVRLDEYAIGGPLALVWPGPLDGLMGLRNRLTLRRLARLAEERPTQQLADQG